VPVQDIEATVRTYLQRDGHEPGIISGEQIRLGFGQVSRAVALEPIQIEASAMKIADHDTFAVLARKILSVKISDAAIRSLLVAVVSDRTDPHRKGRISSRLPFVITGFNKMKE